MKKYYFLVVIILLCASLNAQTLLVQPYLQDAEPTSIRISWETSGSTSVSVNWGTVTVPCESPQSVIIRKNKIS